MARGDAFTDNGALHAEAKAFVLLSEEGVAKGIRRVVAVTAAEAQAAIAAGEKLRERFDNAAAMPPQQLEAELGSLKQVTRLLDIVWCSGWWKQVTAEAGDHPVDYVLVRRADVIGPSI